MTVSRTKVEAGTALVGATLGIAGAVLLEPVILVAGAVAAGVATVMRIMDAEKRNPTQSSSNRSATSGRKVAV